MTHPRTTALATLAVGLVLAVAACDGEPDPAPASSTSTPAAEIDPMGTTIVYTFTDASVPPDIHRSFELTVTGGEGTVVVSAYGDELATATEPIDDTLVIDLVTAVDDGALDPILALEPAEPCEGGTTYALTISDDVRDVDAAVEQCGGGNADEVDLVRNLMDPLLEPFAIDELSEGRY